MTTKKPPTPPVKRTGRTRYGPEGKGAPVKKEVVVSIFGDDTDHTRSAAIVPSGGRKGTASGGDDDRSRKRVRMGKRWTEIMTGIKRGDFTWEEFVADLTPAELARGQLMDKDGGFKGRPSSLVPRAFFNACTKELLTRGQAQWKESYNACIAVMTSIAEDPDVKPADRLKAAAFVVERIEGKVPDRLVVTAGDPWQEMLDAVITDEEDGVIQIARERLALEQRTAGLEID